MSCFATRVSSWNAGMVLCALAALAVAGPASGLSQYFNPATMITPDELQPGMKGTCKTVLEGTKPQEFGVEILGVMKKAMQGHDLVLFRVVDGPIVERQAGILSGMSGSPVYVNGRLVGAVSMAYGFSKEPLGMITPIDDMLEAWAGESETTAALPQEPVRVRLPEPVRAGDMVLREAVIAARLPESEARVPGLFVPAQIVLQATGLCEPAVRALNELVKPYNMVAVPGGGIGPEMDIPIEPGSALGVEVVTGDISLAGVGTVTYVDGDRFLAFGHPMMNVGATNFPICTALTHGFVPSFMIGMKLSSPVKTVGTMTQDRMFAVGGRIGVKPELLPIDIIVENRSQHSRRAVRVSACQNRAFTPMAIIVSVLSVLSDIVPEGVDATAKLRLEIESSVGKLTRGNIVYDPRRLAMMVVRDIVEPVFLLTESEFERAKITAVRLQCEVVEENHVAYIENLELPDYFVAPGDEVKAMVVVRQADGRRTREPISIRVPDDTPTGSLTLGVSSGQEAMMMESQMDVLRPTPRSLADLMKLYAEVPAQHQLVTLLSSPFAGIATEGTKFPNLPEMIGAVLGSAGVTDLMEGQDVSKVARDYDRMLLGSVMHPIMVVRPEDRSSEAFREAEGQRASGQAAPMRRQPQYGYEYGGEFSTPWRAYLKLDSSTLRALAQLDPDGLWGSFSVPKPASRRLAGLRFGLRFRSVNALPGSPAGIRLETNGGPEAIQEEPAEEGGEEALPEGEEEAEELEIRKPKVWAQGMTQHFLLGEPKGLAITDEGELTLASPLERIEIPDCVYTWDLAVGPKGDVFVGTGNRGQVMRITPDGKASVFFQTDDLEVFSVAALADGSVVAGTGPRGLIYRIDPKGQGKLIADTDENYIWDLCAVGDIIYAGTGPNGKLLAVDRDGKLSTVYDSPEGHINVVSQYTEGRLCLGTAGRGLIIAVSPDGEAQTLCESPKGAVHALTVSKAGTVIFGVGDFSSVEMYKLSPEGDLLKLMESDDGGLLAMARDANDVAYAGTSVWARVFSVRDLKQVSLLGETGQPECQFTGLAVDDQREMLWACAANPAAVYRAPLNGAREGEFLSQVLDAGKVADWTGISWFGRNGRPGSVLVQTRSGNTVAPDATWSGWSTCLELDGRLQPPGAPPARYFQYRVLLAAEPGAEPPTFSSMRLLYMPYNSPPEVTFDEEMERWGRGDYEVKFTAEDPDGDALIYDLFYSGDGGNTWEEIERNVKETPYTWDTREVPDGSYLIKVVASDRRANPKAALDDEAVSQPIVVDNTAPKIRIERDAVRVDEKQVVRVQGYARDLISPIAGARYQVDDGEWTTVAPADRGFDSLREDIEFSIKGLEAGDHRIKLEVLDAAGNTGSFETTVSINAAPEKKEGQPAEPAAAG